MALNGRMTVTAAIACVLVSTVMYPLFYDTKWFFAGAGAAIAVAASGALSRLRTLPVVVCLAISVLGLLLYLNVVFEARHSWLRIIPTSASTVRLWDLAGTGLADSGRYAAPVQLYVPGLVLLAAGGIGITAVMTDLIAVRLRSTALAGLPLLVLFTVPITMKAPVGLAAAVIFCLGTAGYLAMLSADGRERIRVWGRLVSLWRYTSLSETAARRGSGRGTAASNGAGGQAASAPAAGADGAGTEHRVLGPEPGPDTRGLAAAGRRVGLASVLLALCVPLIVPGLHPSKLFSSGPGIGTGTGGGSGAASAPDVLSQTAKDLQNNHTTTVLTYTTDAPASLQGDDYLQQYVFDDLTNSGWVLSSNWADGRQENSIPLPQGLSPSVPTDVVTIWVSVANGALASSANRTFLPVPYAPDLYTVSSGDWLVDQYDMIFSKTNSATVKSYVATSLVVDPARADLAGAAPLSKADLAGLAQDLQLPSSYRTRDLESIAKTITAGATTEFGKVNLLASWLSGSAFRYTPTAATFSSAAGLLFFLQTTREGVCVQSAYAMTVLARLLGIPARLVGGFTAGTPTSPDRYVVKTSDAHAWTEIYFPEFGWVKFDPVPTGGDGTAVHPRYQGQISGPAPKLPIKPANGSSSGNKPGETGNYHKPIPYGGGSTAGAAGTSAGTPWVAIVVAVAAAIVLVCGVIAIVAPPARRVLSAHPAERRKAVNLTTAALTTVGAAIVVLALYRLLDHASELDLGTGWATVGIAFGAACAVMLVVPAIGRVALRRWRWLRATDDVSRAHTAWREFRDDLEDFGVAGRPSEPPRTLANRVSAGLPEPARLAIGRLALAEERASYSARPPESARLRRDGTVARRGIAASAGRGSRWLARIFPASVVTALANTAARVPDRAVTLVSGRWTERRSVS
jgi:transglutaminase-like putative cysteine protease